MIRLGLTCFFLLLLILFEFNSNEIQTIQLNRIANKRKQKRKKAEKKTTTKLHYFKCESYTHTGMQQKRTTTFIFLNIFVIFFFILVHLKINQIF